MILDVFFNIVILLALVVMLLITGALYLITLPFVVLYRIIRPRPKKEEKTPQLKLNSFIEARELEEYPSEENPESEEGYDILSDETDEESD